MSLSLMPALTRHDVERIHQHSLDLLERVGVVYKTPRALEVLKDAGCPVDYDRTWASLPRELVEWAIEQAPRVVRLCARDPARDVILDGRRPHHTTDSQGAQAVDLESGERRPSTSEDLRRGLLFADALDMRAPPDRPHRARRHRRALSDPARDSGLHPMRVRARVATGGQDDAGTGPH